MTKIRATRIAEITKQGILIGVAGGLAEIIWVVFYGAVSGSDTTVVARATSTTIAWVLPGGSRITDSISLGIAFHMIAAAGLGLLVAFAWRALTARGPAVVSEYVFMAGALTTVWVFNFFVVLPLIGPALPDVHRAFVEIVPYPASLMSKLLFGLAGAAAIRHGATDRMALMLTHVRAC
jgi:hypothetical protein